MNSFVIHAVTVGHNPDVYDSTYIPEVSFDISNSYSILKKSLREAEKEYSLRERSERFLRFNEKAECCRQEIINSLSGLPIDYKMIVSQSFHYALKNIIILHILEHKDLREKIKFFENNQIDVHSLREINKEVYSTSQNDIIRENKNYIQYINMLMSPDFESNSPKYHQMKQDKKWALDKVLNNGFTLHFFCDVLGINYSSVYNGIKALGSLSLDELIKRKDSLYTLCPSDE